VGGSRSRCSDKSYLLSYIYIYIYSTKKEEEKERETYHTYHIYLRERTTSTNRGQYRTVHRVHFFIGCHSTLRMTSLIMKKVLLLIFPILLSVLSAFPVTTTTLVGMSRRTSQKPHQTVLRNDAMLDMRVAVIETEFKNISKKVDDLSKKMDDNRTK
jgi:hypothetical protein